MISCIFQYISTVKTGPFAEHSNQLWNVSGVPLWDKVYSGLIKMYRAEVLSKFPVIQHTLFGSLFTLKRATTNIDTQRIESGPIGSTRLPNTDLPHNLAMPPRFPIKSSETK